jgi:hypothetical protein
MAAHSHTNINHLVAPLTKLAADGANFTDYVFKLKTVLTINGLWKYVQYGPTGKPDDEDEPLPRTSRKAC